MYAFHLMVLVDNVIRSCWCLTVGKDTDARAQARSKFQVEFVIFTHIHICLVGPLLM